MSMTAGGRLRSKPFLLVSGTALVVALIALAIVLADPFRATAYDLDQAAVWITRDGSDIGRVNTQIAQLDGRADLTPTQDVVQDGRFVFLVDGSPAARELRALDGLTLTASEAVALPEAPAVDAAGGTLAVLSQTTGELWVGPAASGRDVLSGAPILSVGEAARLAVGPDGSVAVLAADGTLHVIGTDGAEPRRTALQLADVRAAQLAFAGPNAVVLDGAGSQLLRADGDPIGLGGFDGELRLQLRGDDPGGVLVADDAALRRVSLGDGAVASLWSEGTGTAVHPVQTAGCAYGAWQADPVEVIVCEGEDPISATLTSLPARSPIGPGASLRFRTNGGAVALNSTPNGIGYVRFGDEIRAVDNWDDLIEEELEQESKDPPIEELPPPDQENQPPVPTNDELGARRSRATLLPVLDNDYDPDQDVLRVVDLEGADNFGVQITEGGRSLQVVPPADVASPFSFSYTVSDGKGAEVSAQVKVTLYDDSVNYAPVLKYPRPPWKVEATKTFGDDALKGWQDPEGDPFFLKAATTDFPNSVRFDPEGHVDFTAGTVAGQAPIALTVSDGGKDNATESIVVEVSAIGTPLKPIARNDFADGFVDEELEIDLLANDSDPNGDRLTLVDGGLDTRLLPDNTAVTPDGETGRVVFRGSVAGPAIFQYTVEDPGGQQAKAWALVNVNSRAQGNRAPVAVFDVGTVPEGGSAVVDLLANDYDPDRDVLMVTDVEPSKAQVMTAVLEQSRYLRVFLSGPFQDDTTATMTYRVTDGQETAEAEIRIIPLPPTTANVAPVAGPDRARVRAGDVVTIPVLANDTDPDGDQLRVLHDLAAQPASGEAFVDRDAVRFRAGDQAGVVTFAYQVADEGGRSAVGEVAVEVIGAGEANRPPRPVDLEARVMAGSSVLIQVPLDGIDPDGDSVTLVGTDPSATPVLGVAEPAPVPGFLVYRAGAAADQDQFAYRVIDRRGAAATARVRVVIAPTDPSVPNRAPIAVPDEVEAAPGARVFLPVIANDVDLDGDAIALVPQSEKLSPFVAPPEWQGRVSVPDGEDRILVEVPDGEAQSRSIGYVITDGKGATAVGLATVTVREGASGLPPIARDDTVVPTGDESVVIAVLENDEDPDGLVDQLQVSVEQADGVTVEGNVVRAVLGEQERIVRYAIQDPQGNTADAFIWLPPRSGSTNRAPVPRSPLEEIEVVKGTTTTLRIADYVTDPDGDEVEFAGPDAVSTPTNGRTTIVDPTTIDFTAAELGLGQVVFEVADGAPDRADRRTAIVSLPVRVVPEANEPPRLFNGSLSMEEGVDGSIDLLDQVSDPDDPKLIRFGDPEMDNAEGLDPQVVGATLVVRWVDNRAEASETPRTVTIPVTDEGVPDFEGTIEISVKINETKKPPPQAKEDLGPPSDRGASTSHDVLSNDFHDPDVEIFIKEGSLRVDDDRGRASISGDEVVFTPKDGTVKEAKVYYTATDKFERDSESFVIFAVRDVPSEPPPPQVSGVGSHTATLTIGSPQFDGNAGALQYIVEKSVDGGRTWQQVPGECAQLCPVGDLENGKAHRFRARAKNAVGPGEPGDPSAEALPDAVPDEPDNLRAEQDKMTITFSWDEANVDSESKVTGYSLEWVRTDEGNGPQGPWKPVPNADCAEPKGQPGCSYTFDDALSNVELSFRVKAINKAGPSPYSGLASARPLGPPGTPGVAATVNDEDGKTVTVTVTKPTGIDAGEVSYDAVYQPISGVGSPNPQLGAPVAIALDGSGSATLVVPARDEYRVKVVARNASGDSAPGTADFVTFDKPDVPADFEVRSLIGEVSISVDLSCSNYGNEPQCQAPTAEFRRVPKGASPDMATTWRSGTPQPPATPWTEYSYSVRLCNKRAEAVGSGLCSDWAAPKTGTPYSVPTVSVMTIEDYEAAFGAFPGAPACSDAVPKTCQAFVYTWDANGNPDGPSAYDTEACVEVSDSNLVQQPACGDNAATVAEDTWTLLPSVGIKVGGINRRTYWASVTVCSKPPNDQDESLPTGKDICGTSWKPIQLPDL